MTTTSAAAVDLPPSVPDASTLSLMTSGAVGMLPYAPPGPA